MNSEILEDVELANKNIDGLDKILEESSKYISIEDESSKVLKFLPERGITEVEKEYKGELVRKIRFVVLDANSSSNTEKFFDVGKKLSRQINAELKEGSRTLKIKRDGSGLSTSYLVRTV